MVEEKENLQVGSCKEVFLAFFKNLSNFVFIFFFFKYFYGRRRNCYSLAIRSVHRALVYATKSRALKKQDMRDLWTQRIDAAVTEHMVPHPHSSFYCMNNELMKKDIQINRMQLSNLAVFEPATFEALAKIALHFKNDDDSN